MTHYFRLYFSIEPVVRARRLAAENEIEMCDDREDCCSGKAYSKNEDLVYDLFNDQDRKSRFVIIVSRSSLQNTRTEGILCWKIYGHFLIINTIRPFTFSRKTVHFVIKYFKKEF